MIKHLLLIVFVVLSLLCHSQEDRKWHFGLRTSAFIAHPLEEKNSCDPNTGIIDETSNIGYGAEFFASRVLSKRLYLNFNLGFEKEKYDFIVFGYANNELIREINMISIRLPDVGLGYNFLLLQNGAIANAELGISLIQLRFSKLEKIPNDNSIFFMEDCLNNHFFPYIRTGINMPGKIRYGVFFKFNYDPLPDAYHRRNLFLNYEQFYMKRYRFSFGLEFKI